MLISEIKIRVRYGEVDRMGYLHHGNYPLYLEEGRTELIRKLGLSYRDLEDKGFLLPVREMHIKYFQPVLYDDEVVIKTSLAKYPSLKMFFDYIMLNEQGDLHCEAKTTLVFVDAASRKPVLTPKFFEDLIRPYFE